MFNFLKNKKRNIIASDVYHRDLLDNKEKGCFVAWQFSKLNFANGVPQWIIYDDFNGFVHDKIHLWSQGDDSTIEGDYNGKAIHENDYIISDENNNILIMSPGEFDKLSGTFVYGSDIIIKLM